VIKSLRLLHKFLLKLKTFANEAFCLLRAGNGEDGTMTYSTRTQNDLRCFGRIL